MYPNLMGSPMDLEILSGNGGMMGGEAPQYYNQLAGVGALMGALMGGAHPPQMDPRLAALMGFSLNPFHYLAQGAGALGTGISNVLHGHLPWYAPHSPAVPQAPMPYSAQPQPVSQLVAPIPGASARGGKVQPLGFGVGSFTVGSPTVITLRARPQRPLRGGRVVGSYSRSGATATGLLSLVSLFVGTDGQLLSGDAISFDSLAPTAFGVGVNLTPAAVGQEIVATVQYTGIAITGTDRVDVNMTMFGMTIG